MTAFRRRPSAMFRSVLALLLVCAQFFAAAHALSHVGERVLLAGNEATVAQPDHSGEDLPAAERHERCLFCLAALDLAAVLPPTLPLLAAASLPPVLAEAAVSAPRVFRLPRPPGHGPPVLPV